MELEFNLVALSCDPNSREAELGDGCKFKANLVFIASQGYPFSTKQNKRQK